MEYKGYMIVGDGNFGMKLIKSIGKGAIPLDLRGAFTTAHEAQRAIDYVRKDKDAEANVTA